MKDKIPAFPVVLSSLSTGMVADIRALEQISVREPCEIIVYFEKDLAYNSTYEKDLREYGKFEEHERPFIPLPLFLEIQREMNPSFNDALSSIPLGVTIVRIEQAGDKPRVIGLLPFLDEMDMS
ncbi:hypothetical protein Mhun_1726 [Methanospirillum hungatei JF-1]|uniref:Uncharacterized protein n=1 Tax=Methanospirillum hungatei JF-1 (strain ATCC 27890 / DSM 864 / NBRC 100397 / JF-1) TaxID=323259 RepID=Q2FLK2_METHJ|nr:hypothetical protein [Methanospirillum hungatei]ABD41449.1 hypothetical protein Mhun_1726 [Methanospirillum hungatei JF-1]MBP9009609.1 hypothetical protein [Methanospirillum sp.]MCA1915430.1 hypothetical protein [Methanospirillum hungatei]OQA57913.1 MAG: hypothetical protein BWY45_01364 [Euryarchaeota archaeon ADurb.Bin294]